MDAASSGRAPKRRVPVERGIYRQRNGKYAVCFMLDGKPRFRNVGYDLEVARAERQAFVEAARRGGGRRGAAASLRQGRGLVD